MAASAYRAGAQMGQVHIFDFYKKALREIEQEGYKTYSLRVTRPYTAAARDHFDPEGSTYTQRLLCRNVFSR